MGGSQTSNPMERYTGKGGAWRAWRTPKYIIAEALTTQYNCTFAFSFVLLPETRPVFHAANARSQPPCLQRIL